MGFLSPTLSMTRYRVFGKLKKPIIQTVAKGLKKHVIPEMDERVSETAVGWTSFESPFRPHFEGSSFSVGPYFVFSLCIEKKSVSPKTIKKYCAMEEAKRLGEEGRDFLSRQERKMIKEHVINVLHLRVPATPQVYDIVWNYEKFSLWFCSTIKSANETLESLFLRSFKIPLIRLFPFTMADLAAGLSDRERDILQGLSDVTLAE